jgi:hypothetical protein
MAIAEGWRRGPSSDKPPAEPADVPGILEPLLTQAYGRSAMNGSPRREK